MRADRKIVFDMYDGKCGYCGCELTKGWHVDHIEPIYRTRRVMFSVADRKKIYVDDSDFPERDKSANLMPACGSCNIAKSTLSVEQFREYISKFIGSLNKYTSIYRIVKRHGLIEETGKPVLFYFESIFPTATAEQDKK